LSTLARYSASGFHIYILYPIIYQNIKTELKIFSFRRDSYSKLYRFLQIFLIFFALCDAITT